MSKHRGSAHWSGPVPTGKGSMKFGLGGPEVPYNLTARVEEEKGTNPEQLIAAAHAGCFSMALTSILEDAGIDATQIEIDTKATAHLEQKSDGFWITEINLSCEGQVPGISNDEFLSHAEKAKATCPVSKLYSSAKITLEARLK
jgi:lipoyl-dependent peroxiredoxin